MPPQISPLPSEVTQLSGGQSAIFPLKGLSLTWQRGSGKRSLETEETEKIETMEEQRLEVKQKEKKFRNYQNFAWLFWGRKNVAL